MFDSRTPSLPSSFTVDREEGLIDSSAEKEIQIKQVATGVVHIRAEKVEY